MLLGYSRVSITPEESVPLRGYGYSSGRMSDNIQDPLYASCIALTDTSDNTVTVSMDLIFRAYQVDEILEEATLRLVNIIDDVYPRFMKALWG